MSFTQKSVFASLPRTERGVSIVLGKDPKGKTFLYCNGNSVIIRDIENPLFADIYTEHSKETTVAQYAPSGFYIASGDVSGKIRIWDTTQKEHLLKYEYQPISGKIKDIAWTDDSKRIVVGGEGREKFGSVFSWDTGTTVGEIMGMGKSINSVDFKPNRPYRCVTASEDYSLAFMEGPPFKFKLNLKEHTNFVNAVRYSPSGDNFISCGADGKAVIYDGKCADVIGELGSPAHKGGIYGLSYSPDGSQVLTVSADKTAKIWDIGTKSVVTEFKMGTDLMDMQVGCLWQGNFILTVSLSGFINYLDINNPAKPYRVIKGHNKPITSMAVNADKSTIFTGSSDGRINYWDAESGENDVLSGKGHKNQIQDMKIDNDDLVTVGIDDSFMLSSVGSKSFGSTQEKTDSQPKTVSTVDDTSVVACINHLIVFNRGRKVSVHPVKFGCQCAALHPNKTEVAVGGPKSIFIYMLNGGALTEKKQIELQDKVTALEYSPDGTALASLCEDKCCYVHLLPDYEQLFGNKAHTARALCVAWSPDSKHLATGGLDNNIVIWKNEKGRYNTVVTVASAHKQSTVNKVVWLDNNTVASCGQDSNTKQWRISYS
ncbi:WD repeat-containing protein 1-B-like [Gigantopelta aegis]|uniref:WD repeat-containing protein 1-B-like n=1 Tax=Gigantopelta aegis TaxID=1735272 RepID=UPI001B88D517|nr:WD repeat-containing protein 1-B-like [Gigantopelta aegis]